MVAITKEPIVFFDGVCNLCSNAVDFLLKYDQTKSLKFASLQGSSAEKYLSSNDFDSIVFLQNGKELKKSQAAFALVHYLKWPWKLLLLFSVLPSAVTDYFYDFIARNRYRLFGKSETCRLPTQEEKERFLD